MLTYLINQFQKAILFIVFTIFFVSLPTSSLATKEVTIHILGVNDFHGQLTKQSSYHGQPVGTAPYLSAHLIDRKKKDPHHTILVHAGDMVGASELTSSLLQDEPTMEVLDTIGFDIGIPGNHEFDEGPDEMMRLLNGGSHPSTGFFQGVSFPYVCCNVIDKTTKNRLLPPSLIKEIDGIKIAFIGVVTKDTPITSFPGRVSNLIFLNEEEAIQDEIDNVKKQGVHTVVILAHEGGKENPKTHTLTGRVVEIANALSDDVCVIIAGHTHSYHNHEVNGKLIVQSKCYGVAYEDVTLTINQETGKVISKRATLIPTYHKGISPNQEVASIIKKAEEKVAPICNETVCYTSTEVLNEPNEHGENLLGTLISDAQKKKMESDFAFMQPKGIRAPLPKGNITYQDVYRIQPLGNQLIKMELTGKQLYKVLNQQFTNSYQEQLLQPSGLTFTYDLRRPKNDRIVAVKKSNGEPIQLDKKYTVTVNHFLASGGDGFTTLKEGSQLEQGPIDVEVLREYLSTLPQPVTITQEYRITQVN